MTLLITMATRSGIFMIADSLEIEDTDARVHPFRLIDKLDRVRNLDVVLSFWGITENQERNFNLIEELGKFESTLVDEDNVITVSYKVKNYFERLDVLEDDDSLGFHICGFINDEFRIHHVHHTPYFPRNYFENEDSKRQFMGQPRYIEYPILFNGDNKVPNLVLNLIPTMNDSILYREFSTRQAKEFLIFLMRTAIRLQNFSSNALRFGRLIDYPLKFCEITRDNIYLEIISRSDIQEL